MYRNDGALVHVDPFRDVSDEAKNLIVRMLDPNPDTRISVDEALNDEWFTNVDNLVTDAEFNEAFNIIDQNEEEENETAI